VLKYILRRLGISVLIMLGASLLLYVLTINSGDPLEDLRENPDENAQTLMEARIRNMNLDLPWYERYWEWLTGAAKCVTFNCDLGTNRTGVQVTQMVTQAAGSTLRLVLLATLLAIVIGITIGILTAIRQYSGFDYAATFVSFLFFSLPVFWAAVLLKEFGAIRFNNWMADPRLSLWACIGIGAALGLLLQVILGGDTRRRLLTGGITFVFVTVVLYYFDSINWFRYPVLGPAVVAAGSAGAAVLVATLMSGLDNRRNLYAGLTTVAAGMVSYFVFADTLAEPTWGVLFGLFALAIAVSVVIGLLWGGYAKRQAVWTSVITGIITSGWVLADKVVYAWGNYVDVMPRPIQTIGSQSPNFSGTFWQEFLDRGTQLILPTTVLMLISLASYSRYTRSSMLDVLEQDYVRTARSKGLSERTVITKHAFRNALIPLTTIVAFDFAGLIGGAIITEQVFGWKGMGELFQTGLTQVDPNPVMAFFLVTGGAAVLMNLVADIMYGVLDPRIRR